MTKTADAETGEVTVVEERHVRPFAEWMLEQRKGLLANELSESLNTVVDAVATQGKKGMLTLKIKISPGGKTGAPIVMITDEVTLTIPEPEREMAMFFVDEDANLCRANPAQPALPLREVPAPSDNLKEAQQ